MSDAYRAVSWNRQKIIYDVVLGIGIAFYVGVFAVVTIVTNPSVTAETVIIRACGTAALILLHLILIIGPAARLSDKFLPLLYNRRHLGVTTFLVGLVHGVFSILQFHAFGDLNPLVSLLVSNTRFNSVPDFPFQVLGAAALTIMFIMAATSHDFWLKNLSAPVWKTLHTLVYLAYALLIGHVTLGVLQSESSPLLSGPLGVGLMLVVGLHIAAGIKEARVDAAIYDAEDGFVKVCSVKEIPSNKARIGVVAGERVAVFKYDGKVSAVSNVCQHQNGPLGEGEIIDGCITCPWHGFQYDPATGASPPPFTEKVPTFEVKIVDGDVWVNGKPLPAGTRVEPVDVAAAE
jgi:nitrite reductase/ring-hydroxylating ferredoxin subunit/DMSO/TMAO reductase YedYZ heme-binding membrane subunit